MDHRIASMFAFRVSRPGIAAVLYKLHPPIMHHHANQAQETPLFATSFCLGSGLTTTSNSRIVGHIVSASMSLYVYFAIELTTLLQCSSICFTSWRLLGRWFTLRPFGLPWSHLQFVHHTLMPGWMLEADHLYQMYGLSSGMTLAYVCHNVFICTAEW